LTQHRPSEAAEATDPAATDEALLARIATRDRKAFALLFERYAGRVKGYLMRGGAPAAEADEAAQDVMLLIWRRAETFDPSRAGAAAWIFAIARNRRIDMLRRKRPVPDPTDPHFVEGAEPAAEEGVAAAERDRMVRDALETLPPEQLEVVRLAFFDGLSHAEAAEALSAPLGTVKSRLRLALARLRGVLGDTFAEELLDD
jgi:RNA polymerase sigma-70 factor (ECF subfamily)